MDVAGERGADREQEGIIGRGRSETWDGFTGIEGSAIESCLLIRICFMR
jgi:hypothetical protein